MTGSIVIAALAAAVAVGNASPAAPCRDAAGKVVQCPDKAATAKSCKAKGKPVPCGKYRTQQTNPNSHVDYKF